MFNRKTTLILGAGASVDFGYPTGEKLIEEIINYKLSDEEKAFSLTSQIISQLKPFQTRLKQMQPLSIDTFLSYYPQFEEIGKFCIASILLKKESENRFLTKKNNWYKFLVDALITGCKNPDDIIKNTEKLSIITFNYDVSLEYYLISRLKQIEFFKDSIDKFFEELKIYHVYGKLGCFPEFENNLNYKNYGDVIRNPYGCCMLEDIYKYSKNIQIVGEKKWNSNEIPEYIVKIRDEIKTSPNLYILGFGFYKENMELLIDNKQENILYSNKVSIDENTTTNRHIFYTNYGDKLKINKNFIFPFDNGGTKMSGKMSPYVTKSIRTVYEALANDFDLC